MRKNRKPLRGEAKKRANARSYAKVYLSRGKILPTACVDCGSITDLEMHHEDYDQPTKVIFSCRECHLGKHFETSGNLSR